MASKPQLRNSIAYLFSLGKSVNDVWRSIKTNPSYKFTTNTNIQNAIDRYQQGVSVAKAFPSATMKTTLGTLARVKGKGLPKSLDVSFKFNYQFPSGSSSGKVGLRPVHITISFPPGTTKREVLDAVNAEIRDWAARNYSAIGTGQQLPRATIQHIDRD